ncbi:MAG: elongation factor G [Flavobacteriales bacterium]|nr:elongation factor G [Flavobacteriales bacterium]
MKKLNNTRNIGIIAHVDAGKTTVTERMLYYTGLIHKMGNVDDGNTTMDKDIQEKNRGITISSAAISTQWKQSESTYNINLIDTPGHIDFIVEVERSLRVLDGVVALFCASSGVEPQTENVWFQAEKYGIPKLGFINKMDRQGANFESVISEIQSRLNTIPLPLQIPMGSEDDFVGVIDLIRNKALIWEDETGDVWNEVEIPVAFQEEAETARYEMLETLAEHDDVFFELYTEAPFVYSEEDVKQAIRNCVLNSQLTPILCGAAYKNKGVQPLLDAIALYLPSPEDQQLIEGIQTKTGEKVALERTSDASFTGLVFKVISDKFMGKLSMVRIYSGSIATGDTILNVRTGEKVRITRILQMQSDKTLQIDVGKAGDIVAVVGLKEAKTGDSLSNMDLPLLLESIQLPVPVIRVAIEPKTQNDEKVFGLVLSKILDEDPSLALEKDVQTGQMILSGMGELHLEVTLEKIRLTHGIEVNQGKPKVAYKELLTQTVTHRQKFVKQNSGSGQFADITFSIGPRTDEGLGLEFVNQIKGGVVPQEFIPSVEKGFRDAMEIGVLKGYPVESMKVVLLDGSTHVQDSHAFDFELAARYGYKEAAVLCEPKLLEPIMLVEIQSIDEYTGVITTDINKRRGIIQSIDDKGSRKTFTAKVPLSRTFGYISDLRTLTSGRASISMKLSHYQLVPDGLAETL